jgi:hypothetical protein
MIVKELIEELKLEASDSREEVYIKIGNMYYPVRSAYKKMLPDESIIYIISTGILNIKPE